MNRWSAKSVTMFGVRLETMLIDAIGFIPDVQMIRDSGLVVPHTRIVIFSPFLRITESTYKTQTCSFREELSRISRGKMHFTCQKCHLFSPSRGQEINVCDWFKFGKINKGLGIKKFKMHSEILSDPWDLVVWSFWAITPFSPLILTHTISN